MLCSDLQHTEKKMKMTAVVWCAVVTTTNVLVHSTNPFFLPLYHHHLSLLGGMASSHIYDALCTKWVQLRATVQITSWSAVDFVSPSSTKIFLLFSI